MISNFQQIRAPLEKYNRWTTSLPFDTLPSIPIGRDRHLDCQNTKTSKDRLKVQLRAYIPDNTVITTPSSLGKSATQLEVEVSGITMSKRYRVSRVPMSFLVT